MVIFFAVSPPGKRIRELADKLGPDYFLAVRDRENVICRKINDSYELQLTGLDNMRRATFRCWIYVDYTGSRGIPPYADQSEELKSWHAIKKFIYQMVQKYQDLD